MSGEGPTIYGPEPPERDDMKWIILDQSKTKQLPRAKPLQSSGAEMQEKMMSSSSLNLPGEQKKPSFAEGIVSSLETRDVKPIDDGSQFKILSCYDHDTRTMTVWNHSSGPTPKKYISHLSQNSNKTSSCPSLSSLLSEASADALMNDK